MLPHRIYRLAAPLLAAALVACAGATPYQPQREGYGYSEQKLQADRYRVVFTGNADTAQATVQNYLLYRAAELTLAQGYDHFVIVGTDTEGTAGRSPSVGFGLGGFRFGGSGGLGVSVGTSTGGGKTAYRAQAEILMGRGPKPADNAQAFDARELKENLAPQLAPQG